MTRISKAKARTMWESGKDFIICPNKCSPNGFGSMYTRTDCYTEDIETRRPFDTFVNAFEYYNCNRETGMHAAFYSVE